MNLVFLNNYCFEQNIPGNTHIRCVPVDYVDEYPEFVMDGHNFVDDILLLPGKQWIILPCVAESIAFDEKETQTKHGPLTTPSIAAFIPSDTPNIAQVTNFMKSKEWIVLIHYKSGDVKVIGDMEAPARFGSSLTNSNDNKSKGYSINFFSSSKAKTFFIQSELPSVGGGGGDCAPATYQLTLEGEPISGASGLIPSGTSAPIAIDDFVGACDPVEISVNGDLEVTAAAGTSSNITTINQSSAPVVPMAVNVTGNNIEIKVNVPAPSGIAYFEPNDMAYPLPSFADYDDGWRVTNNLFKYPKPTYPIYFQTLDNAAADPSRTLLYDNIHGTKDRFTLVDGTPVSSLGSTGIPIRDHLTRREWIASAITARPWLDLLLEAFARGYFLPSQAEFISFRDIASNAMLVSGMQPTAQGQAFGTTDPSNTINFFGSSNAQVPYTSFAKGTNRPTTLLCKIF
jgi:hypothetical protein